MWVVCRCVCDAMQVLIWWRVVATERRSQQPPSQASNRCLTQQLEVQGTQTGYWQARQAAHLPHVKHVQWAPVHSQVNPSTRLG